MKQPVGLEAIPIFERLEGNKANDIVITIGRIVGYRLVKTHGMLQDRDQNTLTIKVACLSDKHVEKVAKAIEGVVLPLE